MTQTHKGGKPKSDPRATAAWVKHKPKALKPLALHLEISSPAVSKWPQVPFDRLTKTASFLGVEPRELRPDLFPPWAGLI